jgi:hypothetical protein
MAIIVGGNVINPSDLQQPQVQPAPVQPAPVRQVQPEVQSQPLVISSSTPLNPVTYVKATPRISDDPNKHYIVSGGKAKEISKKSSYLLDMLTTE